MHFADFCRKYQNYKVFNKSNLKIFYSSTVNYFKQELSKVHPTKNVDPHSCWSLLL